jgi:hypothetical protein
MKIENALISTGHIANEDLDRLLAANLGRLEQAFIQFDFVELGLCSITIHA